MVVVVAKLDYLIVDSDDGGSTSVGDFNAPPSTPGSGGPAPFIVSMFAYLDYRLAVSGRC